MIIIYDELELIFFSKCFFKIQSTQKSIRILWGTEKKKTQKDKCFISRLILLLVLSEMQIVICTPLLFEIILPICVHVLPCAQYQKRKKMQVPSYTCRCLICWRNTYVKLDRWHRIIGSCQSASFPSVAGEDEDVVKDFYSSASNGKERKRHTVFLLVLQSCTTILPLAVISNPFPILGIASNPHHSHLSSILTPFSLLSLSIPDWGVKHAPVVNCYQSVHRILWWFTISFLIFFGRNNSFFCFINISILAYCFESSIQ